MKNIIIIVFLLLVFFNNSKAQKNIKWKKINVELNSISHQSYFFLKHLEQIKNLIPDKLIKNEHLESKMEFSFLVPYKKNKLCLDCNYAEQIENKGNGVAFIENLNNEAFNILFDKIEIDYKELKINWDGEISGIEGKAYFKKSILNEISKLDETDRKSKKMFPINDRNCEVYLKGWISFNVISLNIPVDFNSSFEYCKAIYLFNHNGGFSKEKIDEMFK